VQTWTLALIAGALGIAAVPWVRRIRHPEQKPFAAYLVFMTVFLLVAAFSYALLIWLISLLGLQSLLDGGLGATVFLLLTFVPAFLLGTWQGSKPPLRQGRDSGP